MTGDKDSIRMDRAALETAIKEAGGIIKGNVVGCPFHHDAHPSGGIFEKDGVFRFTCHTASCAFSGDVFDVIERSTGKAVDDQLRELKAKSAPPVAQAPKAKVFADVAALRAAVYGVEDVYEYGRPPLLVVIRHRNSEGHKGFTVPLATSS